MFFNPGILIPFNYIPLTSLERNLTESQAAWLVSIMGATNTAGRVLVGAAAFKLPVHPFVFMIVVNALGSVGTFLSVWCKTFVLLAVYCGFFGIVFGKYLECVCVYVSLSLSLSLSLCVCVRVCESTASPWA